MVFLFFVRGRISQSFLDLSAVGFQEILFLIFIAMGAVLSILTFIRNLSFIPVMGVLFCSYLLIEIPAVSWMYFFGWLTLGLAVYFSYGYWKSKLAIRK
jgi:hypothetical protein